MWADCYPPPPPMGHSAFPHHHHNALPSHHAPHHAGMGPATGPAMGPGMGPGMGMNPPPHMFRDHHVKPSQGSSFHRVSKSAPTSPIKPMGPKKSTAAAPPGASGLAPSFPASYEAAGGLGAAAGAVANCGGPDAFHVIHKVPVGDSPYVRAKHMQLVDKDPDRAIALFWGAINSGDRVDSALKDMAIVMKQQNRPEEAIEAIKSLRHKCSEQAQESLDNVLLDLYKRCGRLDDQVQLLKHKLDMIRQGVAFNGKRTKTARSQGKKFQVSIEQEATRLLGNLGWAYMQQNEYDAAESVYRKALAIEPDNNKVCNLGICLMKQGRVAEAKDMLRSVTPCGDPRWGSESHLKSYERAQEMLKEIETAGKLSDSSAANSANSGSIVIDGDSDGEKENHGPSDKRPAQPVNQKPPFGNFSSSFNQGPSPPPHLSAQRRMGGPPSHKHHGPNQMFIDILGIPDRFHSLMSSENGFSGSANQQQAGPHGPPLPPLLSAAPPTPMQGGNNANVAGNVLPSNSHQQNGRPFGPPPHLLQHSRSCSEFLLKPSAPTFVPGSGTVAQHGAGGALHPSRSQSFGMLQAGSRREDGFGASRHPFHQGRMSAVANGGGGFGLLPPPPVMIPPSSAPLLHMAPLSPSSASLSSNSWEDGFLTPPSDDFNAAVAAAEDEVTFGEGSASLALLQGAGGGGCVGDANREMADLSFHAALLKKKLEDVSAAAAHLSHHPQQPHQLAGANGLLPRQQPRIPRSVSAALPSAPTSGALAGRQSGREDFFHVEGRIGSHGMAGGNNARMPLMTDRTNVGVQKGQQQHGKNAAAVGLVCGPDSWNPLMGGGGRFGFSGIEWGKEEGENVAGGGGVGESFGAGQKRNRVPTPTKENGDEENAGKGGDGNKTVGWSALGFTVSPEKLDFDFVDSVVGSVFDEGQEKIKGENHPGPMMRSISTPANMTSASNAEAASNAMDVKRQRRLRIFQEMTYVGVAP